jgi:hypothetical protein
MNPYQSPFRPIDPNMVTSAPIPAQQPWEEPNEYRWFNVNDPRYTHARAPTLSLLKSLMDKARSGDKNALMALDGMARGASTIKDREATKRKARRGITGQWHTLRAMGMMEPITVGCPSDSRTMVVDTNGKILADRPLTWSEYQNACNCAKQNNCPECSCWIIGVHSGAQGREIIERDIDAKQAMKPTRTSARNH